MKKLFIPFLILIIMISLACQKKKPADTSKQFTFNALTTDKDTILKGNVTNLRANLSGTATYKWSASAGDIFGSGGVILFGASTCCTGNHTITCTATDNHNNSESKSVVVYVK